MRATAPSPSARTRSEPEDRPAGRRDPGEARRAGGRPRRTHGRVGSARANAIGGAHRARVHRDQRDDRRRAAAASDAGAAARQAYARGDESALGAGRCVLVAAGESATRDHAIALEEAIRNRLNSIEDESNREQESIRANFGARRDLIRREIDQAIEEQRMSVETQKTQMRAKLTDQLHELKELARARAAVGDAVSRAAGALGQRISRRHGRRSRTRAGRRRSISTGWSRNCASRSTRRSPSSASGRPPSGCAWPSRSARAATGPNG